MAGQGGHRSLSVSLQASTAPACVIRLTPALLAALRAASDSGDAATISMGPSTNVLRVGATDFRFKSLPESLCDVITVPSTGAHRDNTPSPALCAAHVCQKLVVTRDLGEERDRIRARGEEAERRLHGRRTVKLGGDGAEPPRGSEYMELQVEFNRRYEQYFRLHQVLQANRNDFAAWREALEIEAKIQERWDRQAQRAKRWDAAFRVLHVELESMKAALGEFVRGMEEGEGARSGGAIASEA
ncbi:hypothetical protein APUTEX25_002695 [Auxenochlorella protothecoides]|uniref:Uncharacterized protein n=1 Tax=Auxenochlorella protothecoides TaxID=3075 RepID=A0A3M7KUA4_AUXPR|nr:hypothetical protein APUTEX25_002695 [Auxenochlorella protothecoides]|eukprot:RMZ54118.1 hypothetical protein APUTEX25_002695 [Auxenochlorella protothecoides]